MTRKELFDIIGIKDMIHLPAAVMDIVTGDTERRDSIYRALMEANLFDLSRDWFQTLYEEELAQRKNDKQDFTPAEVGIILSGIINQQEGSIHEPTAGTGGLIIAEWHKRQRSHLPWEFFPSQNMVYCWELSDRAIPLLLLNLSIRGMMGYVYHGDVLTRETKECYILLNPKDDALAFSDIIKCNNQNLKIVSHEIK